MTGEAVSDIHFSREQLSPEFIADVAPILEEHYKELAHYQDIPLKPSFESYWAIHNSGNLRIYVARRAGRIVGYNVLFLRANMHYSTSTQCAQDIMYVTADCRGQGIGRKLINYADECLAVEGVQMVAHHVKLAHPALAHILEDEGYELVEMIFTKRLDRPVQKFPLPTHHYSAEVD